MKKSVIAIFAVVIAFAMSACGTSQPNEWDEYLDKYEAAVDSTVEMGQNASTENMESLLEFAAMAQHVGNMAQEIGANSDKLSSKQAKRLAEITEKLTKASEEFQKKTQQ
jgi:hypothetical protein